MKDADKIVEQPVWTERRLLIERAQLHITTIDIFLAESLELVVAMMLSTQFIIGDIVVAAISEESDISLTGLLQDTLERQ